MDKDKVSNQDNIQQAAEQWLNLVVMLVKMQRRQAKAPTKLKIRKNYGYK